MRSAVKVERARVHLEVLGRSTVVEAELTVGPAGLDSLLPLAEAMVTRGGEIAEEQARAEGLTVRCKKGCAACCRHVVPIAPVEAVRLARLVDSMPEPRRTELRTRFAEALARMVAIGVRAPDAEPGDHRLIGAAGEGRTAWDDASRRYFDARIACPFLEAECCSIHVVRPLACREFSVTSDPELCETLDVGMRAIARPIAAVDALAALGHAVDGTPPFSMPLVFALDWAAVHGPRLARDHDGESLFHALVEHIHAQDAAR